MNQARLRVPVHPRAMTGIKSGAPWIRPWDGNCFLTPAAWEEISAAVRANTKSKYFYVPMARLLESNEVLFDPDFKPKAEDEVRVLVVAGTVCMSLHLSRARPCCKYHG